MGAFVDWVLDQEEGEDELKEEIKAELEALQ